tara:strand:- start:988 stop:1398 length:411 start_codon:yes stop_codon:yes gene_type:complete
MPAKSKAQQRFMGMVHAYKKGDLKNAPDTVKKAAKSMKNKDAKKYASTKHKGKPERVAQESVDWIKEYVKTRIPELVKEAKGNFDVKKMKKLLKKDSFLKMAYKNIRGQTEEEKLSRLYFNLVFKDKKYEPMYKRM